MSDSNNHIINLAYGRKLSYACYGEPDGKPVFLFHGLPGSRFFRHPDPTATQTLNLRIIVPDRPGMGKSEFKTGRTILDWPDDITTLADTLGIERFAIAGYSGGGPYAAACAYAIPERLSAVGIISGIGPIEAPDALKGMLSSNRIGYSVGTLMPWSLWRFVFRFYYRRMATNPTKMAKMEKQEPQADHEIFSQPGIKDILIENFRGAFHQGTDGPALDGWLMTKPWGFLLEEIKAPVYIWQGEIDVIVTLAMAQYMANKIPECKTSFLPEEGHLLIFKYWKTIFETLITE
jgi:pimeloyl-ACP methyl ester carboxylesterase